MHLWFIYWSLLINIDQSYSLTQNLFWLRSHVSGITRDWFAGARSLGQKLFVGEACPCHLPPWTDSLPRFGVSLLLLSAPVGLACDRDEGKIERQDRTDSDWNLMKMDEDWRRVMKIDECGVFPLSHFFWFPIFSSVHFVHFYQTSFDASLWSIPTICGDLWRQTHSSMTSPWQILRHGCVYLPTELLLHEPWGRNNISKLKTYDIYVYINVYWDHLIELESGCEFSLPNGRTYATYNRFFPRDLEMVFVGKMRVV